MKSSAPEGLSVLRADDVVEEGVDGGGEEVEAAGHVEHVLVHGTERRGTAEVNVTKSLNYSKLPQFCQVSEPEVGSM